jgi:asparagine synthase (glutamine-hydrolysing)
MASELSGNSIYEIFHFSNNIFKNELYNYLKYINLPYILQYEDRNSMIFSIESRTPFLDYRLVDFCFNLPDKFKIYKGERKAILKDSMSGKLPEDIIYRKKQGFPTPMRDWIVKDSGREIKLILESEEFRNNPFFDPFRVIEAFKKYSNGDSAYEQDIWKVLAVYTWYKKFIISS